jgi:hypothetical protein
MSCTARGGSLKSSSCENDVRLRFVPEYYINSYDHHPLFELKRQIETNRNSGNKVKISETQQALRLVLLLLPHQFLLSATWKHVQNTITGPNFRITYDTAGQLYPCTLAAVDVERRTSKELAGNNRELAGSRGHSINCWKRILSGGS